MWYLAVQETVLTLLISDRQKDSQAIPLAKIKMLRGKKPWRMNK